MVWMKLRRKHSLEAFRENPELQAPGFVPITLEELLFGFRKANFCSCWKAQTAPGTWQAELEMIKNELFAVEKVHFWWFHSATLCLHWRPSGRSLEFQSHRFFPIICGKKKTAASWETTSWARNPWKFNFLHMQKLISDGFRSKRRHTEAFRKNPWIPIRWF